MSKRETLEAYEPSKVVVFDTETTGTGASSSKYPDEILSLAVMNLAGDVLYEGMFKPVNRVRWPKAEAVNGISPAMVADKPGIADCKAEIEAAFAGAKLLVGYNIEFDLRFLEAAGIKLPRCRKFDVMTEFAKVHGEWDEYHEDWRWCKLIDCAAYYDLTDFGAHDALADVRATAHCFKGLLEDPWLDEPRRKPKRTPAEWDDEEFEYEYDDDYYERVYIPSSGVSVSKSEPTAEVKQEPQPVPPAETPEVVAEPPAKPEMKQPGTPQAPKKGSKLATPVGIACIAVGVLLVVVGTLPVGIIFLVIGIACVAAGRK